jgi:hypothetical protein
MKTQYTPGPWIYQKIEYQQPIIYSSNHPEGKVCLFDHRDKMADVNARLIAASPMLLEALKLLQEVAARTTQNIVAFDGASELDSAIDAARAAIAAAEGTN